MKTRWLTCLALGAVLGLGGSGCGNTQPIKPALPRIGVIQIMALPVIDAVRTGFLAEMSSLGFRDGESARFDIQNAQGDMSTSRSIAQKLVASNVDLIFSITSPSPQAVAQQTNRIPIVFGAVTDPVAAGILKNTERPGGNVTGVSDLLPIEKQLDLFAQIMPTIKSIGMVFDPGESNSKRIVDMVTLAARKRGILVVTSPVTGTREIYPAAAATAERVDAFFSGGYFTGDSGLEALLRLCRDIHKPLFASDIGTVERGGLATYGTDYASVGRAAARIASRILKGERAGDIPVVFSDVGTIVINRRAAHLFGVSVPESVIRRAARTID